MPKKRKKDPRPRQPKVDSQIPLSSVRPIKILGPRYYLQHAREYPILGCWIMAGWKKAGITPVIVARQQESDKVIFVDCLVDLNCLGVKNAFAYADYSQPKFQRELPQMCNDAPEQCSVELAHEIIYGGLGIRATLWLSASPRFHGPNVRSGIGPARDSRPHKPCKIW